MVKVTYAYVCIKLSLRLADKSYQTPRIPSTESNQVQNAI